MTADERLGEVASLLARGRSGRGYGLRDGQKKPLHFGANRVMNDREPEAVLAGLPTEVMDELVMDLAEAVVAMLEQPTTAEPGDGDDASSSL
jgi:hypothetical protein